MNKNLLKTFLVAVGLAAGTSAWAEESTTTYDFEDGNKVFTEDSRITVSIENDETLKSNVVAFTNAGNAQNGYSFAHYDFTNLLSDKLSTVTVKFDFYNEKGGRNIMTLGDAAMRGNTGGSSKVTYNKVGAIFRIGSDKNNFFINDENLSQDNYCNQWLNVEVVVDVNKKTYSYSVKNSSGEELKSGADVPYYDSEANSCTQIDAFGYINNSKMAKIDNLSITSFVDESASYVNYSINYQFEGVTVYSVPGNNVVGATVESESAINVEGIRYLIVANEVPQMTLAAGENVLNVPVRKPYSATLKVTKVIGGVTSEPEEIALSETDDKNVDWSYSYSLFAEKNSTYYGIDNPDVLSFSGTFKDGEMIEKTVSYSKANENVVYFAEAESLSSTDLATGDLTLSNGGAAAASAPSGISICTLPAGDYRISTVVTANAHRSFVLHDANEEDKDKNLYITGEVGNFSGDFTLATETPLVVSGYTVNGTSYNQSARFDYILIEKRISSIPVTIAYPDGLATYTPAYDLDFTNAKNIAAYTATISGDKVNLTRVNTVAAGEGVLIRSLNGGATEEEIPVAAETVEKSADNMFVGTLTDIEALATEGDGVVNYILNDGDLGTGFYRANNQKVGAGKAYLSVPAASAAKISFFSLDGTVTAIEGVEAEAAEGGKVFYNLSGQRVENPAKGLYIVNGKKVIIK